MTAIEIALGLSQLTFPVLLAGGVAIPFIAPTSTVKMIPLQLILFGVALVDLWVVVVVGTFVLLSRGNVSDIIVALTLLISGFLISYAVIFLLTSFLIETSIYRQSRLS